MSRTLLVANRARLDGAAVRDLARTVRADDVCTDAGEARERVRTGDHDRIVVAGGDGTVNVVVDALAGRDALVEVVARGSANDLARSLAHGAPRGETRPEARAVDVLSVNGRRFVTVGGVGIPARVAARANELRGSKVGASLLGAVVSQSAGDLLYSLLALEHIARRGGAIAVRVEHDLGEARLDVDGVFVCNQATLAGNLTVSPASDNADGIFEIVLVPASRRRSRILTFSRMWNGLATSTTRVIRATHARLRIDSDVDSASVDGGDADFFGDGEILARGRSFDVELHPRSLRVRVRG